jgi:iron complex transport system ATP-binding protein
LVARALAQDTPLIILDEPTTHLDLLHKVALFKLLKNSLKKRKNAFCFRPMTSTWRFSLATNDHNDSETVVQDDPVILFRKEVLILYSG